LIGDLRRVEDDADRLSVAGLARARLLVRRVGREDALVADGGAPHAGQLPEALLGPPEAAEGELGYLRAIRVGPGDRAAADVVRRGIEDRLGTTGQGGFRGWHGGRLAKQEHAGGPPSCWMQSNRPRSGHQLRG